MNRLTAFVICGVVGGCDLVFHLEAPEEKPVGCSPLNMLVDEFARSTLPPWINQFSTPFMVENETMTATVNNNTAEVAVEPYFDLRESSIAVTVMTVGEAPPTTVATEAMIRLDAVPSADGVIAALAMRVSDGNLEAGHFNDVVTTAFVPARSEPYDPDLHRRWRIRYAGDSATFETSDQGEQFIAFQQLALPFDYVRPHLRARAVTGPLDVTYDDLNVGETGSTCPVSSLADDFATLDRTRWGRTSVTGCELTSGNGLTLLPLVGCDLGATTLYDLVDQAIEVELEIEPATGLEVTFDVENAELERSGIRYHDGAIESFFRPSRTAAITTIRSAIYDGLTHRRWRLRATRDVALGEQLLFETSADGMNYESFLQTGELAGVDRVVITLRVSLPGAASPPVRVIQIVGSRI